MEYNQDKSIRVIESRAQKRAIWSFCVTWSEWPGNEAKETLGQLCGYTEPECRSAKQSYCCE
jgi:hypothetical protein